MPRQFGRCSLHHHRKEPVPMVRFVPRWNDTRARFARPYCVQRPHFFVIHDFSTAAIGLRIGI